MTRSETRRRGEGRSRVYDLLLEEILSLRLEPGSTLDEADLAETYGVSRTPLREAIIRLSGEGLVRLRPNRSARVAPMDVHNLREYHEAAELIHRVVARWAAARRSDVELEAIRAAQRTLEETGASPEPFALVRANVRFHASVAAAAHNRHIADQYDRLLREGQRLSNISLSAQRGFEMERQANVERVIREHRAIVEAIADADADAADRLSAEHARSGRDRLMSFLASSGAGSVELA